VLVAIGEHDPPTTTALNRKAAGHCTDARFTTIRDADPLIQLERPAEVVDLVTRFLPDRLLDGLDYCNPIDYLGLRLGPGPGTTRATVMGQALPNSFTRVPI